MARYSLETKRDMGLRNKAISNALVKYGYTLESIGDYLHIRYTAVSKLMNKDGGN